MLRKTNMKRIIPLAIVAFASQAVSSFAGETVASSKEVVAPPPPPPASYYRANEWDLGAFGTYDTSFNHNRRAIGDHAWGGGLGLSYFPWLYGGFRIQGNVVNTIPGDNTGGQLDGDFILRYPLDLLYPNIHLAPYAYAGIGGFFSENGGFQGFHRNAFGFRRGHHDHDSVLGNFGGGLEYRFTPHIGIFSEVGYEVVDGPKNNFMQVNFGLKYAF
jgi:hypothetical protein